MPRRKKSLPAASPVDLPDILPDKLRPPLVLILGGPDDWLPFLIYGLFALMIPATMMIGSFVFAQRPHRRVRARIIPFESGVSLGPPKQQRFTISFYLTAMLFIVFDIEIVFLYPLAVILHLLGWFGFFELLTFLIVLLVAYVYIWRKGALQWH